MLSVEGMEFDGEGFDVFDFGGEGLDEGVFLLEFMFVLGVEDFGGFLGLFFELFEEGVDGGSELLVLFGEEVAAVGDVLAFGAVFGFG